VTAPHRTSEAPRTVSPVSRSLWRNYDFVVLWTGETVSQLGSSMSFFVFPLIGYAITGSTGLAALTGATFSLGAVASRLPAGALVDRFDRKRVLVGSNLLGAVLYASVALEAVAGVLTLAHLIVVAGLTGIVSSFFRPAETAAIRSVVPVEQLPTAFSQKEARGWVAQLIGPPVGGALYAVGRALPFAVDAITYAASTIAVATIRTPLPAPAHDDEKGRTRLRSEIAEGVRYLWAHGFLRAIALYAIIINFATAAFFTVLPLKLLKAGVHPVAIGSIDTVMAVAGIVGAFVAPVILKRTPTGLVSIATSSVVAVTLLPVAFTDDVITIAVILAAAVLLLPAGNASVSSYMVASIPDRLQGRTQAALGFCGGLLMPLGTVLGGLALGALGGETAMILADVLVFASVLPLLLSRHVRTLPRPDQWDLDDHQSLSSGCDLRSAGLRSKAVQ
jgi:MFS family permease